MFERKKTPDVEIHIEGFKTDFGLQTSFGAKGTGNHISTAFGGCIEEWCKEMKDTHSQEVAIIGAATIAAGIIKGMGEDAERVWEEAHTIADGKKGAGDLGFELGKELIEKLENKGLAALLMKALGEIKEG